ncbi:hypothetical protein DSECCO2_619340 [anaerobic digester metagenome]
MSILYFNLMYSFIFTSMSSPAILNESLSTIPPREIMAISVVPPPMSIIMFPTACSTGSPAPMAAAIGSSTSLTFLAPESYATSSTAFLSIEVTPTGKQITMFALMNLLLFKALFIKYFIIALVISKSAITPF